MFFFLVFTYTILKTNHKLPMSWEFSQAKKPFDSFLHLNYVTLSCLKLHTLIQYMFILPPTGRGREEGYLRRMIFMEFIESSHAWDDTGLGGRRNPHNLHFFGQICQDFFVFNPAGHDIGLGLGEIVNRV